MSISRGFGFSLTGLGQAEQVTARLVSADFFSVLGIKPALGRAFAPGEDGPGAEAVAVISAAFREHKFGSAPDVLGKSLTLDGKGYTIVGILPANFNFGTAAVYVPIGQWSNPGLQSRSAGLGLHGIGRLKPGVTVEQAQADIDRVTEDLAVAYPATNKGQGGRLVPLKERVIGDIGPVLLMLLGAVAFVLLIACVNVSNLLLARSTGRAREFAIRAALGAGRLRLLRQSLTESMLLAVAGGGLGLLIAGWGTEVALGALPTALPRAKEVGLDGRVLIFTLVVSLLTGVLSGLAPAFRTSHARLSATLKEGGRVSGTLRHRAQGLLVAVEIALALVLLVGAGLMIRSLSALWNVDPGFRPDNVLTFSLTLPPSMQTAEPNAIRASLRELNRGILSTPGVEAASFTQGATPLQGEDDVFFWLDGQPKPASQSEMHMSLVYIVEPDYLKAMGIPLKQGRFFTDRDDERSGRVAVIDEAFAHKYFGTTDPIGKGVRLDDSGAIEIVGVVGHVRQWGVDASDSAQSLQAELYLPFRGLPDGEVPSGMSAVVRYGGSGSDKAPFDAIRRVVQAQHSENVIFSPQTMNETIAETLATQRFSMILLDAFAAVALLLATMGLYGVIAYLVGQRTHELGIRIALGARRPAILGLVLAHGLKMSLFGVGLGLVAAVGLTRLLTGLLFGVTATDPTTFTVITTLIVAVSVLACLIPAWRATQVDPMVALRHE
ncbi:MAG: ABC transporter permease [Acidobacteriota bacterium]